MKSKSTFYSRYFTYIKPLTRIPLVKNYAPAVFTLLVMTIMIFFAIKPTVETILVLQKKIANADEVLDTVNKKVNDLSQGKKNYDSLDQSIKDKIVTLVPDVVTLRTLAQSMEQIAAAHQASISALQVQPLVVEPEAENQIGSITDISFTFNTGGGYSDLVGILNDLKTSGRLLSVDNISLSAPTETKSLILSLSGKAYYLK